MLNIFFIQTTLSLLQFLANQLQQFFFPFYFGNAIATNPLPQFFFPSISTMPLPQMHCHKKKKNFLLFWQCHCHKSIVTIFFPFISAMSFHKSITTNFFPFISSMSLPQINHKFFLKKKFLPKISATWLPQFFFSPIFDNLVATIHIFSLLHSLQFRQLGCHNWFPFRALPLAAFWAFHGQELALHEQDKNFGNLITKIQFFLLSHHITYFYSLLYFFFLQIRQRYCRNSIFFLILSNNFRQ